MAMKYLLHNKRYCEYMQAQDDLNRVLDKWILAFQKTQPKATTYGDKVQLTITSNRVEEYVIEVEEKHLYDRIKEAKLILTAKEDLLNRAEAELRKSKNVYDLIYTAKWVDGERPKDIYRKLNLQGLPYSTDHVYAMIRKIKQQINREY